MRVLLFDGNNVHEEGKTQVTIRRGTKWSDLQIGTEVGIRALGGNTIKVATVSFIHRCSLEDIPQWLLDMEHDPVCRSRGGLLGELTRVYGEGIPDYETMTVVGYTL